MAKQRLNFHFHNPNTAEEAADFILKMFIDANLSKVEQAIQSTAKDTAVLPYTLYLGRNSTKKNHSV